MQRDAGGSRVRARSQGEHAPGYQVSPRAEIIIVVHDGMGWFDPLDAVIAYGYVVGEAWKPFERTVENPGQTVDRKAAELQMAAPG